MANKFTRWLKSDSFGAQLVNGITNPKGVMGNFQHATRIFVDNNYRLSPRTKFMYYVKFDIDDRAHNATAFTNKQHAKEVSYLIKTSDLPKFRFEAETKNQYNRKKIVYKMITYEPINMTFHDDNAGIMNAMWAIYYGTYLKDRHLPLEAYNDLKYRAANVDAFDNFRYGMDNNKTRDMFKSITIYTMSRRRYLGYTLVNPKIINWSHGQVDYSASDSLENSMTIEYESVLYSAGQVSYDNPSGFATLHYDTVPSPLTVQGGGVANLFGDGGVLDGLESIFGDVESGTAFGSLGGFIGTAIKAINVGRNIGNINIGREIRGIISNPNTLKGVINNVSGLVGTSFPKPSSGNGSTPATQKTITPPIDFT